MPLKVYLMCHLYMPYFALPRVFALRHSSHALQLTSIPISLETPYPYMPHVPALQPSASWELMFNYLPCNMT